MFVVFYVKNSEKHHHNWGSLDFLLCSCLEILWFCFVYLDLWSHFVKEYFLCLAPCFCIWKSYYSSIICWTDYLFFTKLPLLFLCGFISELSILFDWSMCLFFWQYYVVCLDYCRFIINLEVKYCQSSSFVVLEFSFLKGY